MSSDESWLVTGIHGCIGAWVGLILAKEDKRVVGLDRSDRDHRLRLICTPEQLARIGVVNGDVADLDLLERTLDEHAITHVVHLAAPLVVLALAIAGGVAIRHSGSWYPVANASVVGLLWFTLLAGGPTMRKWILTGQHRYRSPARLGANKQLLRPI